jgi:hypothetical protein
MNNINPNTLLNKINEEEELEEKEENLKKEEILKEKKQLKINLEKPTSYQVDQFSFISYIIPDKNDLSICTQLTIERFFFFFFYLKNLL